MSSTSDSPRRSPDCGHLGSVDVPGQNSQADFYRWANPRRPMAKFTIVGDDGLVAVHEGVDLTLDRVIAFEACTDPNSTGLGPRDEPYDLVVLEGLGIARAVIRRAFGHADRVVILDDVMGPVPVMGPDDDRGDDR